MNQLYKISKIKETLDKQHLSEKDIASLNEIVHDPMMLRYYLKELTNNFNNEIFISLIDFLIKNREYFLVLKTLEDNYPQIGKSFFLELLVNNIDGFLEFESNSLLHTLNTMFNNNLLQYNDLITIVKIVLTHRGHSYKSLDHRNKLEHEKIQVAELLGNASSKMINQIEELAEIVFLLDKYFNLVAGDGEYDLYTPKTVFTILRNYINLDFESNFLKIKKIIVKQYKQDYKRIGIKDGFKGWEHMGAGISSLNDEHSLFDRHFVMYALTPALEEFYKFDDETWNYIKENLIEVDEKKINTKRPDFLNRAVIPLLIQNLEEDKYVKETKYILKKFILMRSGIPYKTELIFQALRNSKKLSGTVKLDYVKEQLKIKGYNGAPANVFVEQIVSDLAAEGNTEANEILKVWLNNSTYLKRHGHWGFNPFEIISKLISSDISFDEGIDALTNYVNTDKFKIETEHFEVFKFSRLLVTILQKDINKGTTLISNILNEVTLTPNQQNSITSIIDYIPDDSDLFIQVYRVLDPILTKYDNNIAQIEQFFSENLARQNIVKLAEKLARNKFFDESLKLIRIFIQDKDPIHEDSVELDLLKNENEVSIITTVRGYCAWALLYFCNLSGRAYLAEVTKLVRILSQDSSYYVRMQACVPLTELAKNRHTKMPNIMPVERFISFELAQEIESIAFDMLVDKNNQSVMELMKSIVNVFGFMRSIEEDKAMKFVNIILNLPLTNVYNNRSSKSPYEVVIDHFLPLIIFYAEFRAKAYKSKAFEAVLGKDYWYKVNTFNDKPFKSILFDLMENSSESIKVNIAWNFWRLGSDKSHHNENFKIAIKYLEKFTKVYNHEIYERIYYFIEENIDEKFTECFSLWTKCIINERKFFKGQNDLSQLNWWPFYKNGDILLKILNKAGKEEFIKWMDYLANYPKGLNPSDHMDQAVKKLIEFKEPADKIEEILNTFIENRSPNYYEYKKEWEESNLG